MRIRQFCLVLLLVACSEVTAGAQSADKTVLKRKGMEPEAVESVSFDRIAREFRVTKGNATFSIPEANVEYCRPPKPDGFDRTADAAGLEGIVEKYHRLWWDVEAFKRLMPLHMKNGDFVKAIRLYRDMVPILGQSMPSALQREYWNALMKNKETAALQKELANTVANGGREASAWAYIMRGDLLMAQGKRDEALVEGYLKAVLLFDDIASARKPALEKTIKAMEEGGDSRAEKFRKMLRSETSG